MRAMPHRVDGERISNNCHQCERTFEPLSEEMIKKMVTTRIGGDDD